MLTIQYFFFLNSGSQPGGLYPLGASAHLQWGHNKTYNYLNYSYLVILDAKIKMYIIKLVLFLFLFVYLFLL